uniref:Dynamin GTPase n=1 Tax=Ditylenchus dipsaci TaxID=166011 RepID=A0A915DBZ9_9BILA
METLIPVISKLQDVFATVGSQSQICLPQIVVVGSQSAGKSSVIEGIVGRDFLPRGVGIVTRRPLLLHLVHVPLNGQLRNTSKGFQNGDWAVFEHKPERVFTDFELVRQEIEEETDRLTGRNKGISPTPINLKIYSHKVVNLSLVDLPGITKLPIGDQPADIEVQIRRMISSYIRNPSALILAVTAANQDFATSDPLKFARDFDKDGDRTLAVLTKLDLMDSGTDAVDVLTGRLLPVKLGIIGVVNRSQADIRNNKRIEDCVKDEEEFLRKKYPMLASVNGIKFLSKTLNKLLTRTGLCFNHHSISNAYAATIDGTSKNIDTTELSGGARICYVFSETFRAALDKVDPLESLSAMEVLTAIRNATGPRPSLFVPEISLNLIYEELLRIVQHCGIEIQQEMQRFPLLFDRIKEIISDVLVSRLGPAKEFHPDFGDAHITCILDERASNSTAEEQKSVMDPSKNESDSRNRSRNEQNAQMDQRKAMPLPPPSSTMSYQSKNKGFMPSFTKDMDRVNIDRDEYLNAAIDAKRTHSVGNALREGNVSKKNGSGKWTLGGLFNRSNGNSVYSGDMNENDQLSIPMESTMHISPKDERDCNIIKKLIQAYFVIVRKSIHDMVPKSIMKFLVNHVRDNLQSELVRQLYASSEVDKLLHESDQAEQKRKESAEMLLALQKASCLINEIREARLAAVQENTVDRLFIRPHAAKSNQGNVKFDHKGGMYFKDQSLKGSNEGKVSARWMLLDSATPLFAQVFIVLAERNGFDFPTAIALFLNKLTATYGCLSGSRSLHSSRPARII